MRKNPWYLRIPTPEEERWFRNLVDLHDITHHWAKTFILEPPASLLKAPYSTEIHRNIWTFQSFEDKKIEDFLMEDYPGEFLQRLEESIWLAQDWVLTQLYQKTSASEHPALDDTLKQLCWDLGLATQKNRWASFLFKLKQEPCRDLRTVLLALHDSPFAGYPRKGFLIKRALPTELQIELHTCPHQRLQIGKSPVVDLLCRLHTHWMRGFGQGLSPQLSIQHTLQAPRCTHHWSFS